MCSSKPADIEILATKNYKKTHLNLFKCTVLRVLDSNITPLHTPNLSVLCLKNTNISLKSINCPNVERIYAGNNGVSEEDIYLMSYSNLKELDVRTMIFHLLLMKKMMH